MFQKSLSIVSYSSKRLLSFAILSSIAFFLLMGFYISVGLENVCTLVSENSKAFCNLCAYELTIIIIFPKMMYIYKGTGYAMTVFLLGAMNITT